MMFHTVIFNAFGRPFVKQFALCYRSVVCLSVLSVCDVGVLWPNGWTDQDETWHAGTSRPWPHCVTGRWGPRSPSPKGRSPQFSANVRCDQTAGWTKMPLGMEVGLGPGDFVLDGDPAPPPQKGAEPPKFSAHVYCGQTAGLMKLVPGTEVGLSPGDFVLDGDPVPFPQKGAEPLSRIFGPFLLSPNGCMYQSAQAILC